MIMLNLSFPLELPIGVDRMVVVNVAVQMKVVKSLLKEDILSV